MQLWFTCKENELNGPYTENEVIQQLEAKEILGHHWLRKQEEVNWQLASDCEDFATFVTKEASMQDVEKKWVLLKLEKGIANQSGPYSQTEVLQQIYMGQAEYSDYVWQQGFNDWKRIGDLDCFVPKTHKEVKVKKNSKITEETEEKQLDLFSNIMSHTRETAPFYKDDMLIPEEVKEVVKNDRFVVKKTEKKEADSIPSYYKPVKNKKQRWWFFSFFCLFLTILIAVWGKSGLSLYL